MNKNFVIILFFGLLLAFSCNPDCEPIAFFEVTGDGFQHEQEILIRANPSSVLSGKNVIFTSRSRSSSVTIDASESRFIPNVGLLVKVPSAILGNDVDVLIDDPDCGPVSLGRSLTIGDEDFFTNNANFIPPPNLNFIIPTTSPVIPPLVRNAWLHPEITDYCLWFRFVLDSNDVETETLCNASSRELSLNCDGTPDLYHDNAVYGVIDKVNNEINFWIDRSSKGAGIEEFEGVFVDINSTAYAGNDAIPGCGPPWVSGRSYMMLVVSKQTGRQLLLYQQQTELDANGQGLDLRPFELEQQCRFDPN
ncbi:MAG: hypothetical protein OEQ53_13765 [Saprospiraceae bacterium]|nr:hypothetical protein [Saprospiraceae bacterium]